MGNELTGNAGDDTIDGGAGDDIAIFRGKKVLIHSYWYSTIHRQLTRNRWYRYSNER